MVTKDSEANPAAATVAKRRTVFRMELFLPNGGQFKRVIIRRLGANAEFRTGVVARAVSRPSCRTGWREGCGRGDSNPHVQKDNGT